MHKYKAKVWCCYVGRKRKRFCSVLPYFVESGLQIIQVSWLARHLSRSEECVKVVRKLLTGITKKSDLK